MFVCKDCGCVFDEDEMYTWTEHHPYGAGYASESFSGCPSCKSGDYVEAESCVLCGEYHNPDEGGMCETCLDDAKNYITKMLKDRFYLRELEAFPDDFLYEIYEEVCKSLKEEEANK